MCRPFTTSPSAGPTATGEDITDEVLDDTGYTFLLVSPHLEMPTTRNFDLIDQLYEYAEEHGYPFYCLTASGEEAMQRWRDMTGAEYPFCQTDEITLKTIIRSNPGLLLLKQGTVIRKWSHNRLPVIDRNKLSSSAGATAHGTDARRLGAAQDTAHPALVRAAAALLTLADRTVGVDEVAQRRKKEKKKQRFQKQKRKQ